MAVYCKRSTEKIKYEEQTARKLDTNSREYLSVYTGTEKDMLGQKINIILADIIRINCDRL